jgi:peptidylprolyl isomerase
MILLRMCAVKTLMLMTAVCAVLLAAGCGGSADSSTQSSESTAATTSESASTEAADGKKTAPRVAVPKGPPPSKLESKDLENGSGAEAKAGDKVTVQYVAVLYKGAKVVDSSWSRNEPFSFKLGAGEVIPGWDQGIEGMKAGGRRELIVPANLAYGKKGFPPAIGPNEAMVFVIDLLKVE